MVLKVKLDLCYETLIYLWNDLVEELKIMGEVYVMNTCESFFLEFCNKYKESYDCTWSLYTQCIHQFQGTSEKEKYKYWRVLLLFHLHSLSFVCFVSVSHFLWVVCECLVVQVRKDPPIIPTCHSLVGKQGCG